MATNKKYHIGRDGTPKVCTAKGECKLGGKHFDNLEAAQKYADELNEKNMKAQEHIEKVDRLVELRREIESDELNPRSGESQKRTQLKAKEKELEKNKQEIERLEKSIEMENDFSRSNKTPSNCYISSRNLEYGKYITAKEEPYKMTAYEDVGTDKLQNQGYSLSDVNEEFNRVDRVLVEKNIALKDTNLSSKEYKEQLKEALTEKGFSAKEYNKVINRYEKARKEIQELKEDRKVIKREYHDIKKEAISINNYKRGQDKIRENKIKEYEKIKKELADYNDKEVAKNKEYLDNYKEPNFNAGRYLYEHRNADHTEVDKDIYIKTKDGDYQKAVYVDTVSDENDAAVYSTSVMCYDGNYYKLTAPAGSRPFEHKIIIKEGKTKVII